MAVLTTQRRELLDALSNEFLHNYRRGRTFLAVDGLDGAGQARFADDLAERMGRHDHAVFRASIDDFQRPRAERGDRYDTAFDYDLFRRVLVEPFRLAGSTGFTTAAFDARRDVPLESEWRTGPQDATLIVDGVFLNRPELRGIWNSSIWLDGGEQGDGQSKYHAHFDPRALAAVIVDDTDRDHPSRVYLDRC
ncbi:MAG TPA: uridine kinase [Rhodoglobus sp.]|nr:uridine kinase [Rhodoglobus sp.]